MNTNFFFIVVSMAGDRKFHVENIWVFWFIPIKVQFY